MSSCANLVVRSILYLDHSLAIILGPVCGVIFLAIAVACIALCHVKRKKARNNVADVGIPMSTISTSESHTPQPGVVENLPEAPGRSYLDPRLPVGYTPDPRSSAVSSLSTNPEEAPPPYPG